MEEKELRRLLLKYGALDNEYRLKAFLTIGENEGISFNDLARKLGIERGLCAYHLGILKAANLVALDLERRGRSSSHYRLTDEGRKFLEYLMQEIRKG
ncbi:MAG: helix-turn-helix domain-containing protein [Candidatus Bathyarchaeia archaeon]